MRKSHLPIVASLLGITILCLTAFFRHPNDKRFNSAQWKGADRGTGSLASNVRKKMVNDLVENHLHKGMKRKDVLALLGKSTQEDGTGVHGPLDIYWLANPDSL